MKKCWWCGDIANTGEHKIKKTIVKKLMFENTSEKKINFIQKKERKIIQSSKSDYLKYEKNLCTCCNTSRSQSFDRAYDKFFDYIIQNENLICSSLKINTKKIGCNQEDLFRYFIKSFCCMIDATHDLKVPRELIDSLNGSNYNKSLVIQFYTNGEPKKYPLNHIINVTDPVCTPFSDRTFCFYYFESFGWFYICYIYQRTLVGLGFTEILVGRDLLCIYNTILSFLWFKKRERF